MPSHQSTKGKPRAATKKLPSAAYLRRCFRYNKQTGTLTWKRRPREFFKNVAGWRNANREAAGHAVSYVQSGGYISVKINGVSYQVQRVIWRMVTGKDPLSKDVDHKNTNKTDNRWANLRLATPSQTMHNRGLRRTNTSGCTGVHWTDSGTWRVEFAVNRVRYHFGCFSSRKKAVSVCRTERRKLHGAFYRG